MVKLTPLVKRAIQQKLPWAPRFGISREAYARLTGTPVPETVPRQSSLVKLRSRLIQVPHEPDNPHIFYEATLNNGQRVTMCPKLVKSTGVSLTISPVTHAAEVAVKSASIMLSSPLCAKGSISKKAPMPIRITKLIKIIFTSCVCIANPLIMTTKSVAYA